jgi:hypothetical protein
MTVSFIYKKVSGENASVVKFRNSFSAAAVAAGLS